MIIVIFFDFIYSITYNGGNFSQWIFNKQNYLVKDIIFTQQIYSRVNLSFSNCEFISIENKDLDGGAIYISFDSPLTNCFTKCHFKKCYGNNGGSIYINTNIKANSSFSDCTFEENAAITKGGAIFFSYSSVYFHQCNFIQNFIRVKDVQESNINGGAISSYKSNQNFENCLFQNNFLEIFKNFLTIETPEITRYFYIYGGAIYYEYNIDSIFTSCIFINNSNVASFTELDSDEFLYIKGGAIQCERQSSSLFRSCIFQNNSNSLINAQISALSEGGAICADSVNYDLFNCTFKNNFCYSDETFENPGLKAGAISFYLTNFSITECDFINNSLYGNNLYNDNYGGALHCYDSSKASFNKCNFINNSVYQKLVIYSSAGGAVYITGMDFIRETNVVFNKCNFNKNGVYPYTEDSNTAGGSIYSIFYNISFQICSFIDNYAAHGCELWYNYRYISTIVFNNCIFERKNDNKSGKLSFFIIKNGFNMPYINMIFVNNQIRISNSEEMNFISGSKQYISTIRLTPRNNCIDPYNDKFTEEMLYCNINDESDNILTFNDIFSPSCSSRIFTPSNPFSESSIINEPSTFSLTSFSETNQIQKPSFYSATYGFSPSLSFTESSKFSKPSFLTATYGFSPSLSFTETKTLSKISFFSATKEFSKSSTFSETNIFSQSLSFSKTGIFTDHSVYSKINSYQESLDINDDAILNTKITSSIKFDQFTRTLFPHSTENKPASFLFTAIEMSDYEVDQPNNDIKNNGIKRKTLIGIIVGCVVIIVVLVVIIIVIVYKKKFRRTPSEYEESIDEHVSDDNKFSLKF